jgi:Gas vesicle synthesis protein GvpL/GvpF
MYTYAFIPESAALLELPAGIAGSLQAIWDSGIGALVEAELDVEALQRSDEQLMRAVLHHDQVIREVFERTVLLPLRFGTYFVSSDKLLEHLQAHAAEYLDKLAELSDKAEYTLKLIPVDPITATDSEETSGKGYFLAKKQQFQRQLEQQQQQQSELEALQAAIAFLYPNWRLDTPRDGIERIHLLVNRADESALSDHFNQWLSLCSHWQLSLGEALPPYHFV